MEKIWIGYVQGVHGLRGDLKIKNKFEKPQNVFIKGKNIYLNEEKHIITNTKFYKGFYLTTIDNIKSINAVEKYKGYDVYIDREELDLNENEYIFEDLIGLEVLSDEKSFGKVKSVVNNGAQDLIEVDTGSKSVLIPIVGEFIRKVDVSSQKIYGIDLERLDV